MNGTVLRRTGSNDSGGDVTAPGFLLATAHVGPRLAKMDQSLLLGRFPARYLFHWLEGDANRAAGDGTLAGGSGRLPFPLVASGVSRITSIRSRPFLAGRGSSLSRLTSAATD